MLAIEIASALKALDELPVMTEKLKDLTLYVANRDF
jgi:hypothetical protein